MTNPNASLIAVILDKSGSMDPIRKDTIGSFNSFLDAQKKLPGDVKFSLTLFDTDVTQRDIARPINYVAPLAMSEYVPAGGTAYYDAIALTIDSLGAQLAAMPESERPSKVVMAILTDGEENSSKHTTLYNLRKKIEHQTATYNWQFLFLAANLDAIAAATDLGIMRSNSMQYAGTARGMGLVMAAMSSNVAAYCSTGDAKSLAFSDEQREENDPSNAPSTP